MRRRLSARLLILDAADRVLLFRFVYKRGPLAGHDFWGTPGGGVEDGETRREVALQLPDGEHVVQDERYFVVRVTDIALSRDDWTDLDREVMVEHRWWSLEEIARTDATVWPENPRQMIEQALRHCGRRYRTARPEPEAMCGRS